MKIHCENRNRESESLLLTRLSTMIDRTLIAIISFGSVAFLGVLWMHLTASAHLAVVQTLQALASIGTIISIVWTLVRGNSNPVLSPVIVSTKTFKCLFLMLAFGTLIGSLKPGVSDMATLLCSIPTTLVSTPGCTDSVAEHEDVPTSEEYLITHMPK